MKILLILAHDGPKRGLLYTLLLPSITLEQVAALIPEKHKVELLDERYQNVDLDWEGDLVGISCLLYSANHAYAIADHFRERGKTVILGGYHPSALPYEAKEHADSVVIGEAEISLPQLLQDYEMGKLKPFYQSKPVEPQEIPPARRIKRKIPFMASIQATRGCPVGCKFCSIQNIEGLIFRPRPIKMVVKEMKSIRQKQLFFADSSMTINPSYTKSLFREMKGLDKRFECAGNINILARDDKLLKLASEAGCKLWQVGFESISQETLDSIEKRTNKVLEYASAVRKIHDHGMMIMGLFMFGFDTDKTDVFDKTLETIDSLELDRARFSIVTPYPGTQLFNELECEGRILTRDWSKYDLHNVVFRPKNMTPDELYNGFVGAVRKFHSFSNLSKMSSRINKLSIPDFVSKVWRNFFAGVFYREML